MVEENLPAVTKLAIPKTARRIATQNWTLCSAMCSLVSNVKGAMGRMDMKRNWSVKMAKMTTKAMKGVDDRNDAHLLDSILSNS
jgi:hypothetical protein